MQAKRSLQTVWVLLLAPSLACGGAAANDETRATLPETPKAASASEASRGAALEEIAGLNAEIRELRGDLQLEPPAQPGCFPESPPAPCFPSEPRDDRCRRVCSIADHICDNAEALCERAHETQSNRWAEDKCKAAKESCRAGKDKCCRCGKPEGPPRRPLIM